MDKTCCNCKHDPLNICDDRCLNCTEYEGFEPKEARKDIYNLVLDKLGMKNQIIKCIEELSELQKELCKYFSREGNIGNVIEEVADVEIMLEQIKLGLNITPEDLNEVKDAKLRRVIGQLREEENEIT